MPDNNYLFVNPYNFVPLQTAEPDRKSVDAPTEEDVFTGVIDYSVRTVTPLFIPNTSNADAFKMKIQDHKSYDFFSYDDLSEEKESTADHPHEPVIPGSEMRGLIRSYYEIITNSCLPVVETKAVLSKRTHEKFKPGLLKRCGDVYKVFPAKLYLMRTEGKNSTKDDPLWDEREVDHQKYGRQCYIQERFKEGSKVFIKIGKRTKPYMTPLALKVSPVRTPESTTLGYIFKGEAGPLIKESEDKFKKTNKHCCHVFALDNTQNTGIEVDISILDKILTIYDENKDKPKEEKAETERLSEIAPRAESISGSINEEEEKKRRHNGYKDYKESYEAFKSRKEGYFPVFYSVIKDAADPSKIIVLLSPSCITRDIHKNTLADILQRQNRHEPCSDPKRLCPACSLFGIVTKGDNVGIRASSVRFSDLRLESVPENLRTLYLSPVTLQALSSPKISNMEFYLKRPTDDSWFWTYDYYVNRAGELTIQPAEINGRKFYWHQMIGDNIASATPDRLNNTVRPLRRDKVFKGKLYFDRVSKTELNRLIYLLNAGSDEKLENKQNGYKLGMGKPLGLGSVAIAVDDVKIRKVEIDKVNKKVRLLMDTDYEFYEEPAIAEEVKEYLKKLTGFGSVAGKPVSYPYPNNPLNDKNAKIYGWFTNNHTGIDRKKSNRLVDMPQSRNDMLYKEYMVAMNPQMGLIMDAVRFGHVVGAYESQYIVKLDAIGETIKVFYTNVKGRTVGYGELLKAIPRDTAVKVRHIGKRKNKDGREYDNWAIWEIIK